MHFPYGKPPTELDVLWRVEAKRYSIVLDYESERYGVSEPRLEARWFAVTKRTPKGAWLGSRFVLLTAHKRWACPTLDEAVQSFKRRKERQIGILQTQLSRAQADLALLTNKLDIAPIT